MKQVNLGRFACKRDLEGYSVLRILDLTKKYCGIWNFTAPGKQDLTKLGTRDWVPSDIHL